jgi:hypothetical protein
MGRRSYRRNKCRRLHLDVASIGAGHGIGDPTPRHEPIRSGRRPSRPGVIPTSKAYGRRTTCAASHSNAPRSSALGPYLSDQEFAERIAQRDKARQTQDRTAVGTFRNEEGTRTFGGRRSTVTAHASCKPPTRREGGRRCQSEGAGRAGPRLRTGQRPGPRPLTAAWPGHPRDRIHPRSFRARLVIRLKKYACTVCYGRSFM